MKPWRHRTTKPDAKKLELKDAIGIATSLITAIAAVFAGAKYVFGFFTPVQLEIELPPVIEFRCSRANFDGAACMNGTYLDHSHMTVTAALYLRATGDPAKEATITSALATVTNLRTKASHVLTWLWSADFVPGKNFERKQVTASSLKGGEASAQEMWFFPLEETCGGASLSECKASRRNFVTWAVFVTDILSADPSLPRNSAAYSIEFFFQYREGKDAGSKSIKCVVEVSETLQRMANPADKPQNGVLYLSAPCRRSLSAP